MEVQVLVVGAGPTMAAELARHQIPFRIVDKAATGQPAEAGPFLAHLSPIFSV